MSISALPLQRPSTFQLPLPAITCVLAILLYSSFGPNFYLCIFSLCVLAVGIFLLWRPGESAVLVLNFVLNWIGASTAAFHANWLGIDIEGYSTYGASMRAAAYLSLIGLVALTIGIRLGARKPRPLDAMKAREIVSRQPVLRWFQLYAMAWGFSFVALILARLIPGLSQLFIALASIKWAFFFILAYASFVTGPVLNPFFIAAFCVEFAMGIGGFFSDFRTVFMFTIFAAFASGLKLKLKTQAILGILITVLIFLGVVWSEVKNEYRRYVSEGQQAQAVNVSYLKGVGELFYLVQELDGTKLGDGATRLLQRLTYIENFGLALNYVPLYLPHEDGALLGDAIVRPFTPRLFFPEKSAVDDSARTTYYTGGVVHASGATSISIGYMAETYIDFGAIGMMAELSALGLFYGAIYRFLLRNENIGPLTGMAFSSVVFIGTDALGASITKFLASIILSLIVIWIVSKYALPHITWATGRDIHYTKRVYKRS